ncbi:MAG TPA: tetratricopeptide repeat protein [Candidatus Polarisedimenticolaceae bacterium]|nr:tetratricopeptide repeat protein [Candidatus Polarisedimenticolaceae bacterium]
MSPKHEPQTSDRRLLLAIAAFVVAAAAGVALLSGLAERGAGGSEGPTAPALATAPREPAPLSAEPASLERPAGPALDENAARFVVDPDADPWQEGVRAYHAGRYDEACAWLAAEVEARPERAEAHYLLGLAAWKSSEPERAVEALERSAVLNPSSIRTYVNLARVRNEGGDYERALRDAERAVEIDPLHAGALYQKARTLANLGRNDEAVELLDEVIARDPGMGHAYNLLGLIGLREGRDRAALDALTLAAERLPDVAFVHNNLGLALERSERAVEAAQAFRRAIELDAGHAAAAVSLARVQSNPPVNLEAIEVASGETSVSPVEEPRAVTDAGAIEVPAGPTAPDLE